MPFAATPVGAAPAARSSRGVGPLTVTRQPTQPADAFHRQALLRAAIEAQILGLEGGADRVAIERRDLRLHLIALAGIAHRDADARLRHCGAGLGDQRASLRRHLLQHDAQRVEVEAVERRDHAAQQREADRRGEESERRGDTRARRHDQPRDAELARDLHRMHGARAADRHQRVALDPPRLLKRMDRGGLGHGGVHRLMHRPGGLDRREAERRGEPRGDRRFRRRDIELHLTAEEAVGREVAEQKVAIRDRRLRPAEPVAGGPRVAARAVGADAHKAERIDARERSAARADFDHLDHRHLERQPAALAEAIDTRDLEVEAPRRLAAVDQRGLGGGAAHVEAEDVGRGGGLAIDARGLHAAGGTGLHQADRVARRDVARDGAAIGQHQEQRARDARLAQPGIEPREVAREDRQDIGVGNGGGAALVLADLRHEVRGEADGEARRFLRHQFRKAPFVHGIGEGVQQADRNRLHARIAQCPDRGARRGFVERRADAAIRHQPFRHLEPEAARHQRVGAAHEEVVGVVPQLRADLLHVPKTLRGQEAGRDPAALDQRIGDQRRAVDDVAHLGRRDAVALQQAAHAFQHGLFGGVRRGQHLAVEQPPVARVEHDEVGEGAADVDADAIRRAHAT
jgi:hypothetical protein